MQVTTVAKATIAKSGQECLGKCSRPQGKEYWRCRKAVRWTSKDSDDYGWDYCSPDSKHTRWTSYQKLFYTFS